MRFWITATVLLVAALLVGCGPTEQADPVTIRALRLTGDTWFKPDPQPIWRFTVTNTGKSDVCWRSGVEVRGNIDPKYSRAGGFVEWPEGILAPGRGIETNLIVPAKTGSVWRAYAEFWTLSPQESTKHMAEAEKFGLPVYDLRPRDRRTFLCNDEWHH